MDSNSFCILPFIHLYAEPKGEMKPCCIAGGFDEPLNLKTMTIDDAFNSDSMKQLRKDMLNGVRNKVCDVCYKKEDTTGHSPRNDFNANQLWTLPTVNEDYSVETDFQHVDIRFSNLCNFKCRMCNHDFSSNWYEDFHKIKDEFDPSIRTKVLKVSETISDDVKSHLKNLRSIYFAGGEPLIMPEHYNLLKHLYKTQPLIEGTDIRKLSIHYNTNLSVIKYNENDLIELWKGFEKVNLSISCDGIGKVGEYQRTGFNHDIFIKNLKTIRKYFTPNDVYVPTNGLIYNFQYTTTVWNVLHIFDFIKFMMDNEFITSSEQIDFYYSWGPYYSALNSLSENDKKKTLTYLENGLLSMELAEKTEFQIKKIIDFLKTDTFVAKDTPKTHTKVLDDLNGTNYFDLYGTNFE